MSGEKTEQATAKRQKKAREEGQVAKSADFTGSFVLVLVLVTMVSLAPTLVEEITAFMKYSVEKSFSGMEDPSSFLIEGLLLWTKVAGPIIAVGFVGAFLISYLQVGPGFSTKAITPDMKRLSPGEGIKRLFSTDRLVDLVKTLTKLGLVGAISISVYWDALGQVSRISERSISGALARFGELFTMTTYSIAGVLFVVGIADFLWQRHSTGKKMMMSKQEIKDEYKESEGDPYVKGQRKALHRQLIREAGMKNLKQATAVVVNPTHVAAAIAYDDETMDAPIIVTSGFGDTASRIKKEAIRLGIPIVQNVPLARALAALEIDETIPESLYDEVVVVLQYVYGLEE